MSGAARRAIVNALVAARDNLTRALLQRGADPEWKSGNGESIDEIVAGYNSEAEELEAALRQFNEEDR